ncbi:MAG TPA: ATP-dependent helicase C-terminal domain-containing protein [Thermoanaerobaculia bacterium]
MDPLPVDRSIDDIAGLVRTERRAIVVAPPGSGKTTRIPPALIALGKTILLQPRRVAARALARRIASERGWTIGKEIGWHIRFERRFSKETQLLVATEGILTARLQSDPLLSDFSVIVLDEFHERSIHADLALALAKQAVRSRDDLALVVMSATLDTKPLADFLGARVITIEARKFPIEVRYATTSVAQAVRDIAPTAKGHILCFLPGAREIENTIAELRGVDARVLPLHGSLDVDAQEAALAPSSEKKVIVATNVAETSLTVEGVTDVIDSGLHKVLRYDSETAVDHLVTEQITADSAEQRAGRAGRTAPGRVTRLWDARILLRPHREPEIRRVDLASPVLDIISWGGDPKTFEWFERPQEDRITSAMTLLEQIGAMEEGKLTPLGEQMRALPLHPRLARVVIAANGADEAIALATENEQRELTQIVKRLLGNAYARHIDDTAFRQAILAGYPDRVAMRRGSGVLLATGTGARLAREIEHTPGDFFVALEVRGDLVHRVVPIEREWLAPTRREVTQEVDGDSVRAIERTYYMSIVLHEQQVQRRALPKKRFEPERRGPATLLLPSGRSVKLEYRDDGTIVVSVKLQELFGLAETPRIGPEQTPVTFELLAPNGRPVQITKDLRSFWNGAYQQVRRELRARYPKHPWPDDPWTAVPTHKTKKRH